MTSNHQPKSPRPSASLIIIDGQNRVLMVERNPKSKSFAGAYVFPGGNFDPQQDTSTKLTAIRETFEESGLLLGTPTKSSSPPNRATLAAARKAIHAQRMSFTTFLAENGFTPDIDALLPFTQWITPPTIPRRFHTHFYITFLSSTLPTNYNSDQELQHVPTPDGGIEVISVRFIKPQVAISECQADKITLIPPQFYLLTTLASVLSGDETTSEQKETIHRWARGSFGRLVFTPRALPDKDENGHILITYEGDESRGGQPGARHRTHVRIGKGAMHAVALERNIDIFANTVSQIDRKGFTKL